jgi:hypothetical protein
VPGVTTARLFPAQAAASGETGALPGAGKEKKTTVTSVEEFGKGLLTSAFGAEGVAEKALAAQEKQVTVMELQTEILNQMKDHLAAIVRRGGGAVATGPA